ncbi:hypothetical protein [Streptomyces nojiriensis]|uniref:hypothetical protein n=1 Tax=Streptomyces nojiriensis TaxID=66374 RepID=UPI0036B2A800
MGTWTSETGARLTLEADRRVTGTDLHKAMLGGTSCSDSVSGKWVFFSVPSKSGYSGADDSLTSGQHIAISRGGIEDCLVSALVRRDERGFNLCLVEDPDSSCSARELLRPQREQPSASRS